MQSAQVLSDGPVRVGSRIETEVNFLGRQRPIYEVIVFEPPHREQLLAQSGPLRSSTIAYVIEPLAEKEARFTLRFAVRPNGPLRLFEPLLRRPFERQLAHFMANLQRALE